MPAFVADLIQRAWDMSARYGSITAGTRKAKRFARFGDGTVLMFPTTALMGEQRIEIGAHTHVGPLATLSTGMPTNAHLPGPPILTIGDRCLLGKGIGIVAQMAYDPARDTAFDKLDASHLFAPSVTRLGLRHGVFLRGYVYAFITLFAPQYSRSAIDAALAARTA